MKGNLEWRVTRQIVPYDEAVPKPNKNLAEIVRCKDCKFWNNNGIITKCEKHIGNGYPGDWFCADGEKKVDA